MLRVILLVVGTSLLTLTTTPVQLTDGLERVMRPLEVVRFPAGEVAMMLTIALRFIPTTAQEAEKILIAQTARGARFDEGGLDQARAGVRPGDGAALREPVPACRGPGGGDGVALLPRRRRAGRGSTPRS